MPKLKKKTSISRGFNVKKEENCNSAISRGIMVKLTGNPGESTPKNSILNTGRGMEVNIFLFF